MLFIGALGIVILQYHKNRLPCYRAGLCKTLYFAKDRFPVRASTPQGYHPRYRGFRCFKVYTSAAAIGLPLLSAPVGNSHHHEPAQGLAMGVLQAKQTSSCPAM